MSDEYHPHPHPPIENIDPTGKSDRDLLILLVQGITVANTNYQTLADSVGTMRADLKSDIDESSDRHTKAVADLKETVEKEMKEKQAHIDRLYKLTENIGLIKYLVVAMFLAIIAGTLKVMFV